MRDPIKYKLYQAKYHKNYTRLDDRVDEKKRYYEMTGRGKLHYRVWSRTLLSMSI